MFSLVELKTMGLDTLGISQLRTILYFLLMFGIPMVPYFFLYHSLREVETTQPAPQREGFRFRKLMDWMHIHRHPQPLHH